MVMPESDELLGTPEVKPDANRAKAANTSVPAAVRSNQNRSKPTCNAQSVGAIVK